MVEAYKESKGKENTEGLYSQIKGIYPSYIPLVKCAYFMYVSIVDFFQIKEGKSCGKIIGILAPKNMVNYFAIEQQYIHP